MARALRDLRRWPEALAQFRDGMRAYPSQPAFAAGIAMTLADADRLDEALAAGEQLVRARPGTRTPTWPWPMSMHAGIRRLKRCMRPTARATWRPAPPTWNASMCSPCNALAWPAPRWNTPRAGPSCTEAQMRRLQADALAEQVRLASMPTRNEADRFAIADRVLAHYDALIPAWSTQGDETRDDVIRARIDRLHALHARYRMRDLASEYEALRAEGVAVPRYALGDVASAYLYLRQPEQAAAIYQQVAQAEKATTTIRWTGWATRPAATTRWPRPRISTAPLRSWTRPARAIRPGSTSGPAHAHPQRPAPAEHAGRRARLQADDTPEAQARLEGMARNAPNNSTLKSELAALYRARSLPRAGADAENGRR